MKPSSPNAHLSGVLRISVADYATLRAHGEETYPYECCGVLLGKFEDDVRLVEAIARAGNTRLDALHNRYSISPQELIRIQRQGREQGVDIVGFYHSHPDHPAQWSKTDLEEAHWIGCSYVITAVEGGKAAVTNSFALCGDGEEDKHFQHEPMELL